MKAKRIAEVGASALILTLLGVAFGLMYTVVSLDSYVDRARRAGL
jgi:hypothetical protein